MVWCLGQVDNFPCLILRISLHYTKVCICGLVSALPLSAGHLRKSAKQFLLFKIEDIYPNRSVDYNSLLDRFHVESLTDCRLEARKKEVPEKTDKYHIDAPKLLSDTDFVVPQYAQEHVLLSKFRELDLIR
ncbi:hypothetical protein Trydic_g3098 [Trypoxylus dichotomus]